ncbi:hypothetical protein D3C79_812760 [compost metagenome]
MFAAAICSAGRRTPSQASSINCSFSVEVSMPGACSTEPGSPRRSTRAFSSRSRFSMTLAMPRMLTD